MSKESRSKSICDVYSVRQTGMINPTNHPLFVTWRMMNYRCYSHNHGSYKSYGGVGIVVCTQWRWDNDLGFVNFLADVGERPHGTTLDRIDPYGNYCKENCRWATKLTQQNNFRVHKLSTTGITGVVISETGLYVAQTYYDGAPLGILVTEDIDEARLAVEAVREFKIQNPDGDLISFAKTFANYTPIGKKAHARKTSKYYGVCWNKDKQLWRATGYYPKNEQGKVKTKHLGYFEIEEDAYSAVLLFLSRERKIEC